MAQCSSKTKNGRRCKAAASRGGKCIFHQGKRKTTSRRRK